MIKLTHINKTYVNHAKTINALINVTLSLPDNGMIFVVGASGSGKTTLLNILGLMDCSYQGQYMFDQTSVNEVSKSQLSDIRSQHIGVVFQEHNLFDALTVKNNILISLDASHKELNETEYQSMLDWLDISHLEHQYPTQLSTGEKQRVAIARALIKHPKLILADEPTGSLDEENALIVLNQLKQISSDHLVIVVSHQIENANLYADRIISLQDGSIIEDKIIVDHHSLAEAFDSSKMTEIKQMPKRTMLFKYGWFDFSHQLFRNILLILLISMISITLVITTFFIQYDNSSYLVETLEKVPDDIISVNYQSDNQDVNFGFKIEQVNEISALFQHHHFTPIYKHQLDFQIKSPIGASSDFILNGAIETDAKTITQYQLDIILGHFPVENDDVIEIALSKNLSSNLLTYTVLFDEGDILITTLGDFIGKNITHNGLTYQIVGIIDAKQFSRNLEYLNQDNHHIDQVIWMGSHVYNEQISGDTNHSFSVRNHPKDYFQVLIDQSVSSVQFSTIQTLLSSNNVFFNESHESNLSNQEVLISLSDFETIFRSNDTIDYIRDDLVDRFAQLHFEDIREAYEADHGPSEFWDYSLYILLNNDNIYDEQYNRKYFLSEAIRIMYQESMITNVTLYDDKDGQSLNTELNIVGVNLDDPNRGSLYVSQIFYDELLDYNDGTISHVVTKLIGNDHDRKLMETIYTNKTDNSHFILDHPVTEITDPIYFLFIYLDDFINFLFIGLFTFALMIFMLLSKLNHQYDHRKIGLQLAIGFDRNDIIQIQGFHNLYVFLGSFILSIIGSFFVTNLINSRMTNHYNLLIDMIKFNPLTVFIILAVIYISMMLVTIGNMCRLSKKSLSVLLKIN